MESEDSDSEEQFVYTYQLSSDDETSGPPLKRLRHTLTFDSGIGSGEESVFFTQFEEEVMQGLQDNEDSVVEEVISSFDVTDDDFNPFNAVMEDDFEEWAEDDPAPLLEDQLQIVTLDNDDAVPIYDVNVNNMTRRPNEWLAERLPHIITSKPMTFRIPDKFRETYMYGAIYGNENLEEVEELDFGNADVECENCHALYWRSEQTRKKRSVGLDCCQYGRYALPQESGFVVPPADIVHLYTANDARSQRFHEGIIRYNNAFATAFLQGDFKNVGSVQHGLWSLKINGEVKWHNHAYRTPADSDRPPNHGQLYFLDYNTDNADEVMTQRLQGLPNANDLDRFIVCRFETYLRSENQYVKAFETTREVLQREQDAAAAAGRPMSDVVLVINPKDPSERVTSTSSDYVQRLLARGQYTINPTADHIGAVFTGEVPPMTYDAKYFPREQVNGERPPGAPPVSTRTLDIQLFPLIHLHGEGAWLSDTKQPRKVPSLGDYYRYRLAIRNNDFNILTNSKKLFAKWLLNGALRVEYDWLNFRIKNQEHLKVEEYKALQAFVREEAARQNRRVGRIVILPKGVYGSKRHMKDLFYDALALSQKLGHPSWMVTMTTNRNWKEIVDECRRTGTDYNFRYDVVNRSFQMRETQLLSLIVREEVFGKVLGEMTVTEFQGRGLTHKHGLYIMRPEDTPQCGEDVDKIVWAYFPDKEKYPQLYELVKTYMVHNPCGPGSPCWRGRNSCKHGFPFEFRESTDISGKRPLYRRPNNGSGFYKTINGKRVFIDNRWVVPYNPLLLMLFRGHINVMYCPSTTACKYFYGYCLKGNYGNKVRISIVEKNKEKDPSEPYEHDEIKEYKEMRHLGAHEAHYRLLSYPMTHMYPHVEVLPVHLPECQSVVHQEGEEEQAVANSADTKLTAWFDLNKTDGLHRTKLYSEVVEDHRFDTNTKTWISSNRSTIGRLAPVATTTRNSELFHLRLLLANRPGATSYEDLRRFNGTLYETFKEACIAMHLVESDGDINALMTELAAEQFPRVFRQTFGMLLCTLNPTRPQELWDAWKRDMCEDYLSELPEQEDTAFQLGLNDIKEVLEEYNKTLTDFSLPDLDEATLHAYRQAVGPGNDGNGVPTQEEADEDVANLNPDQRQIFDCVLFALDNPNAQKLFFLTGAGGSGKTYFYNTLIKYCKSREIPIAVSAYTGIAATLLIDGKTSHRTYGIPLEDEGLNMSRSTIKLQSPAAAVLKNARIHIWDEVSMVSAWQLQVVDRILRDVNETPDEPFASKIFILGGDFRQILPTIPKGSRADIVDAALTSSVLWPLFQQHTLNISMRHRDDPAYGTWTISVGDGSANDPNTWVLRLSDDMLVKHTDALIEHCFGKDIDKTDAEDCAILCPTNRAARAINKVITERYIKKNGGERSYYSTTSLLPTQGLGEEQHDQERLHYPEEYMYMLESGSLPPHELRLAPGMVVMLLRNLRVWGGLCNGTKLRIERLCDNLIVCTVLNGSQKGQQVGIFRVTFITDEFSLPGVLRRKQFPIRICYAMTINKSQGQTLERVGLYLQTPCWVHGQIYVAVSRVRKRSSIKALVFECASQGRYRKARGVGAKNNIFTQNPVYSEVLRHVLG